MAIVGVGTDIIEIKRIKTAIQRRPKFLKRVFTTEELGYCLGKSNPWPSLAARFAAKESVLKAMGIGIWACGFQEIEILREESGFPYLQLHGEALKLADARQINRWHLSLSHSQKNAIAYVIGECKVGGTF